MKDTPHLDSVAPYLTILSPFILAEDVDDFAQNKALFFIDENDNAC